MDESTSEVGPLIEQIPDDLFDLWRKGPLMLASRASLPVVELANCTLTLRWGTDVINADVEHCNFRWGRPWRMKHNARSARPLVPFGSHDLVLIDFPPLQRGFFGGGWSYNTTPVGYTKESLGQWEAALRAILDHFDTREPPIA